jgi:hypothetical protein
MNDKARRIVTIHWPELANTADHSDLSRRDDAEAERNAERKTTTTPIRIAIRQRYFVSLRPNAWN